MKAKGPKIERETIIRWDEGGDDAELWTASQPVYRRMLKRGHQLVADKERSATFRFAKKLVTIRKPREISDTHRRRLAETAQRLRNGTVTTVNDEDAGERKELPQPLDHYSQSATVITVPKGE
jgi:hypothetical protein